MELVYLWVEEYKNIKNQGFNFSPRFDCEFKNGVLTIDENEDYVSIFPENINITAIVGENGSGKSNLLDLIMELNGWSKIYDSFFFVTAEKKIYTINFNKKIKSTYKIENIDKINSSRTSTKNLSSMAFLSLSPFINEIDRMYSRSINFISIFAKENYQNNHFIFDHFYLNIIQKIPDILEEKSTRKLFNINEKPKYLIFKFSKYIQNIFNEEISEIISKTIKKDKSPLSLYYQVKLEDKLTLNRIFDLYRKIEEKKENLNKEVQELDKEKIPNRIPNLKNKEIYTKVNTSADIKQNRIKRDKETLTKEIEDIGYIKFYFAKDEDSKNSFYFSNGELVLLYQIDELLKLNSEENDLIILIDEGELFLHPSWQKKILSHLINLFENSKFKRQLIFTSHSPFILSDLPKENIIFLEKGKQVKPFKENEQTFGANIHTLLSHGFFMEDGLMGEFAKNKINEVIKLLNSKRKLSKKNQKFCKNIISIIGEPILQKTLEHQLNEKLNPNETELQKLEREQKEIQKKIDELTKRKQ